MISHYYYREGEDRKGGAKSNPSVKATMSQDPEITQEATSLEPLQVSQGVLLSVRVPKSLCRLDQHPTQPSPAQLPWLSTAKLRGRAAAGCSYLGGPLPPEAGSGQTQQLHGAQKRPSQFGVRKLR